MASPSGAAAATDPRAGIRQNLRTQFSVPGHDSLCRILAKYMLFAAPPFVVLLSIFCLHCYPIKFAYDHRHWMRKLFFPNLSDEAAFAVFLAAILTLATVRHGLYSIIQDPKEFEPTGRKKVVVIGAGVSGIVTAKECLDAGHDVVVLEKSEQQGGVWHSRAWSKTTLTSSSMNTSLSDYIFPEVFLDNEHVGFATRDQFVAYLDSYVRHFGVDKVIQLGCEVTEVIQDGKGYSVTWRNNGSNSKTAQTFDYIAVCTGLPNEARPCPLEGHEQFKGSISHSKTYKNADIYRGKRVLIIGTGESASDIVNEVANVSSEPVAVSQHSPVLVLARDHWESPPDYAENRLLHMCPAVVRWTYLKMLFLFIVAFGNLTTRFRKMPKTFSWLNFLLFYKLPVDFAQPTAACSNVHITKSGCMLGPISDGKAIQKRKATKCVGGKTVEFEDGTQADYDEIILANGYIPSKFSFLKSLGLEKSTASERYHLTFDPRHPKIAFVGYTRGQAGALTTLIEIQARWFALMVSGSRRLPTAANMKKRILQVKAQIRGKYMTRSSWFAANYIARHEILCEPKLWLLAISRPFLTYKIMTRSFASWQFRLNGPGAKRQLALDAYESVQLKTNIPGELLHRAMMLTLIVTSHIWWFVISALPLPNKAIVSLNGLFMPNVSEIY